jgi:hypothetical protein
MLGAQDLQDPRVAAVSLAFEPMSGNRFVE